MAPSDAEINEALAVWMGWERLHSELDGDLWFDGNRVGSGYGYADPPAYLSSAEAMVELLDKPLPDGKYIEIERSVTAPQWLISRGGVQTWRTMNAAELPRAVGLAVYEAITEGE